MMLRWKYGGRNVSSATVHLGGKTTKSATATPGTAEGQVSTVKMLGSAWSKPTAFIGQNLSKSYLNGTQLPCHATTLKAEKPCSDCRRVCCVRRCAEDVRRGGRACAHLPARKEAAVEFVQHREAARALLIPRRWRQKVARVGQAIGTNRAEVRQLEVAGKDLKDIAPHGTPIWRQCHGEADTTRNAADLTRRNRQPPKLCCDVQRACSWCTACSTAASGGAERLIGPAVCEHAHLAAARAGSRRLRYQGSSLP